MKDIKLLISSILIFISFFLWYIFADNKNKLESNKKNNKINYVNIEVLKTKIKVTKNEETQITVNWELLKQDFINLK